MQVKHAKHQGGYHDDVEWAFANGCVKFFKEAVQVFGLPPSIGQIYGLLFGSPIPLSFTDIVERLGISKGSASTGLQVLRSLGAVHVASNPDGRREYYEPELSLRQLVNGVLRERIAPLSTFADARLIGLRKIAERGNGTDDFRRRRVKQLQIWRRRLTTVLPFLTSLLGPRKQK